MSFQGTKLDLISGSVYTSDTPGFIDLLDGTVTNIGTFEQDPLDPLSVQMSGSNPSASFYMSSSGKTGIGTTDPLTDVDVRADKFQIQKQGKRQGVLVNEEGNLESFNSEAEAAATGSEFILKYSRGGSSAITKEFLEATGIMSIAEVDDVYGGNALTAFNAFDPKTQDKILFLLEDPAYAKLSESSVGDVLGSIRWVSTSGSSTGLNSRTAGEAATIQAIVNASNQYGTSADLLFKVAGKAALEAASDDLGAAAAPVTALRLDGSFNHELTGSLSMTSGITLDHGIYHRGDGDTAIGFGDNSVTITAGNEIMMQFVNHTQDKVLIGDGGDIDFRVIAGGEPASGNNPSLFVEGSSGEVGIGTSSPSHKLDVHGNARITGSLTVNGSLIATQITSSIISSSVIYSSGSNIFGDATADTHTFNGHITASGNISASGNIFANRYYGDDGYNNYLTFNASSSLFKVQNKTYVKFDGSSAQREVTINEGTNDIDFVVKGASNNPLFKTDSATNKIGMHGVGTPTAGLHIADNLWVSGSNGHITASGNISASGTIIAEHIQSSDDILAADDIIVNDGGKFTLDGTGGDTYITNGGSNNIIDLAVNNTVIQRTSTAGVTVTGTVTATDAVVSPRIYPSVDVESGFFVGTNTSGIAINGGSLTVGGDLLLNNASYKIRTSGSIDAVTHITASGNISASGTITSTGDISTDGNVTADFYNSTTSVTGFKLNGAKYLWLTSSDLQVGNDSVDTDIIGTSINLQSPVTASSHISASGTITAQSASIAGPIRGKQLQVYHANWKGNAGTTETFVPLAGVPDEQTSGTKEQQSIIMPCSGTIKEIILRMHWTSTITTSDDITWKIYNRVPAKKMNGTTLLSSFTMTNPTQGTDDANNTRSSGTLNQAFAEGDALMISMTWASTGPTHTADRMYVTVVVENDWNTVGY